MSVIAFRKRTYTAKSFSLYTKGLEFRLSGTLDGMIDLAVMDNAGNSRTYPIEPSQARQLADKLCAAALDVELHCLYDNDALLR
jgi:hypothetical protein